MKGNDCDVCCVQVKGDYNVVKVNVMVECDGIEVVCNCVVKEKVEVDYDVVKIKCDVMKGNEKDICVKDVKVVYMCVKVGDEVSYVKVMGIVKDVSEVCCDVVKDINDVNYKVVKECCDVMFGDVKIKCQNDVVVKFKK